MSTRNNQLYQNQLFSRIANNLTNALVGTASDDAAIARANYYDSQTQGQDLKNKNVSDLRASIPKATGVLANNILRANTGKPNAQFNQSGVPIVDGGNMSMPVSGNINVMPPANMTQDNYQGTARAMLGDLTYSPNQFAKAIQNLGSAETAKLAQNLIAGGNPDQIRRGAILNNMNPGKFFDAGSANRAMDLDLQASKFKSNKSLEASKYRTNEDNKTKREDLEEKRKITKEDLREKRKITKELGIKKINKVAEVAKYKFDNREIKIAVGKDQKVYIDMATADTLGVDATIENGEEVYVINGKPSPEKVDQVKVNVGKADVYLSKEMADELGIPVNDQGQYVIQGSGYNDGTSANNTSSKKDAIKPKDFMKLVSDSLGNEGNKSIFTDKLPGNIIGGVKKEMKKIYDKEIAKINAGTSKGDTSTAYIKTIEFIISRGVVDVDTSGFGGTTVPKFFYDSFLRTNTNVDVMTKWFQGIGYNKDIASQIANDIFRKRAQNG